MNIKAPEHPPVRLDLFLVHHLPGIGRRKARHLVVSGAVLLNGRKARKGDIVQPNDVVRIVQTTLLDPPELVGQRDLPIEILYADDKLVAVDKPAGMPTHALRPAEHDTVANFLVARFPEMRMVGKNPLEAGLAHRLDTGTSGVLLAARTADSYHQLRNMFHQGQVAKLYFAIVAGELTHSDRITVPIGHRPHNKRLMCACPEAARASALKARTAVTLCRPLRHFSEATLLIVKILTGVRHQIRVHLAFIGHPILGDPLYSSQPLERTAVGRPLLHAARVRLRHPDSREAIAIDAPLPKDFLLTLEKLEATVRRER